MYCSQCGREAKPGARFCAGCGAPLSTGQPQTEAAGGTSFDKGPGTGAILEERNPQQTVEIEPQAIAEATAANLDLERDAEPPPDRYGTPPRKGPKTLIGLGILGAGVAIMAAIAGYVYLAGSTDQPQEIKQDQEPIAAAPPAVPPEPSLSSVGNSPAEVFTDAPAPRVPKEDIQEVEATQILALAEDKVSEARRRATESGPPKRGNRKAARSANGRGLGYLQSGQIAEAVNAFQEGHQADPADVEILNNLGHGYLMQGELASAERHLLSVLTLAPERTPAWSDLGQVYAKRGDTRNAVASFANAYQFSQNRYKTHEFFRGLMENNNEPLFKQALQQATQLAETKFLVTPAQ